ncbi:protein phosphatase 1 regulatory subunit 21 isoform X4 [Latimeria chalumnae]|uniref:protein phosphatase 1 regulatory subunit 21 isoform X4 n=1 Tax=Latimeria chalumnae TaxID=7897 RepID=UPI0003C10BEA|nr:PREDICTED: protein phosphatase 1 regulatory subunit 21 isoform X4 [Latimeria chalumnae]|eukprot:XP_005999346.1 PREDICTED: protein phosphatase 1 regulatory subunit 21 isoform X4 [Latimeria chalumnae]
MAADLQGKYQKLAQEYSKLRAQNQVLKKAVLDEQANSAALKEQMKMKDQSLRKLQQEMDSLIFRNQQLAKRVELLQEELVVLEVKGKKNKQKSDSTSQLNQQQQSVFDEDLQKKIEENERLHIQFFEADEKHKQVESELQARLEVLEKDAAQHQAVVDGLTQKYMDTIEKLQNDKAKLEVKSQTLEREAKDCRLRTEECQQQLKTFHEDLSRKLDQSIYIIQEKVPFNDTKYGQYNVLNVPPHNKRQQFSQYLHENASYVRPMEEGMLHLFESITEDTVTTLETAVKLKEFSHHLISYTCFLKKILPYQLKSLEEECMSSLCTSTLRARNMELYSDMKKMTAAFEKLQTYISLLALPSTKPEALPQMNFSAVCTQLAACLHGLYDVMKDISKHFNQKITLEQELPTVTQKLKTTNDCILSSVVTLANVTGKIATYFSNNLDFFTTSSGYGPKGGKEVMNPLSVECMLQYKKKAVAYIASVKPPQLESVPYEEALSNRRVLLSSTESREGLAQQVQQSQEKIAKLEQEKEHWMLEAQLAKIKLQKENQRIAELDTQLKHALGGQTTTLESMKEHAVTHNKTGGEVDGKDLKEPFRSTSLIGMLTVINSEEVPDGEFREDLIKNHYMTRVAELTSQLQVADSKAVHFYAECRALAKRLSLAEKSREVLTEEIKLANQNITRLQDELTTTKRSYEDQLSMMSDHLCSMNDTLSKQREEIDTLKMSSKGNSKKNRSR